MFYRLAWLGAAHFPQAGMVEAAVAAVIWEGETLTYDLVGEATASTCSEVGAAVEEKLRLVGS